MDTKTCTPSVSICSNVPEFTEPVCFIGNGNPQGLLAEMVEHLESISAAAEANLMEDLAMEDGGPFRIHRAKAGGTRGGRGLLTLHATYSINNTNTAYDSVIILFTILTLLTTEC